MGFSRSLTVQLSILNTFLWLQAFRWVNVCCANQDSDSPSHDSTQRSAPGTGLLTPPAVATIKTSLCWWHGIHFLLLNVNVRLQSVHESIQTVRYNESILELSHRNVYTSPCVVCFVYLMFFLENFVSILLCIFIHIIHIGIQVHLNKTQDLYCYGNTKVVCVLVN